MDAISMLKDDHKKVKALFREFERAKEGSKQESLVSQMIEELSVHAALEEQVFYPAARETLADDDDIVLEALEEHHVVKWTLSELQDMDSSDERFEAKVKVMTESVKHHIKEEEEQMFPKLREKLGRKALAEIGEAMAKVKPSLPKRPMPKAPDEPPGNLVSGIAAGATDKVVDLARGTVRKITGREKEEETAER